MFNSEQINLIMGYDTDKDRPVFSRFVLGDQLDKASIEDITNTNNLKNILCIIDKGFYNNDESMLDRIRDLPPTYKEDRILCPFCLNYMYRFDSPRFTKSK